MTPSSPEAAGALAKTQHPETVPSGTVLSETGPSEMVQSLARGLQVIRAFDSRHPRMTLTDVARRTGLTRAAARRFLLTLRDLGYVAWDGKYFNLTPKILTLGYAYLSSTALPTVMQPALVHLSEKSGESSSGCIRDGDEAVIIARASVQQFSADLGVGSRLPLYCTSLGHVLLAQLGHDDLQEYLDRTPLLEHTSLTPTHPTDILALVQRCREQGYALVSEGLQPGIQSVAVPVQNTYGQVVAAMGLSTHISHISDHDLMHNLLPMLRSEARLLAQMLSA